MSNPASHYSTEFNPVLQSTKSSQRPSTSYLLATTCERYNEQPTRRSCQAYSFWQSSPGCKTFCANIYTALLFERIGMFSQFVCVYHAAAALASYVVMVTWFALDTTDLYFNKHIDVDDWSTLDNMRYTILCNLVCWIQNMYIEIFFSTWLAVVGIL